MWAGLVAVGRQKTMAGCEEGGKEKTHMKGSRRLLHTQAWILGKCTGWGQR